MIRRPRRLRVTKQIRDLVHETSIDKTDLIYPMFIIDGETEDIPSMPNIKRYSLTDLPSALDEVVSAGVGAVLYFGIPKTKDEFGRDELRCVRRAQYRDLKADKTVILSSMLRSMQREWFKTLK